MKRTLLFVVCCLLCCTQPARALLITVDGVEYDISSQKDSWLDGASYLELEPWFADSSGATAFAFMSAYFLAGDPGIANGLSGPIFAYNNFVGSGNGPIYIRGYANSGPTPNTVLSLIPISDYYPVFAVVHSSLPDVGSTGSLFAIGLMGLAWFKYRSQKCAVA